MPQSEAAVSPIGGFREGACRRGEPSTEIIARLNTIKAELETPRRDRLP
jgi:hypothetical protein